MKLDCACYPAIKADYPFNEFIAQYFSECVYTPVEVLSFYIGMSSLGFWICCQLPQFYKNYQKKSGAALSKWFLIEWFSGDLLNLLGCILTKQLATQLATSILFVIIDFGMLCQIFYYQAYKKSRRDKGYLQGRHKSMKKQLSRKSSRSSKAKAKKKTSRLETLDVTALEEEAAAEFRPVQPQNSQNGAALQQTETSPSKSQTAINFGAVVLPLSFFVVFIMRPAVIAGDSQTLISTTESSSLFSLPFLDQFPDYSTPDKLPNCEPAVEVDPTAQHVGYILGWVSAFVYLNSRIPQVIKNYRRKSVEGLSLVMFFCAVMGNTTYGLGVLLKDSSRKAIAKSLPWLVGSLGTLFFDFFIMLQFSFYKDSKKKDALLKNTYEIFSYDTMKSVGKNKKKHSYTKTVTSDGDEIVEFGGSERDQELGADEEDGSDLDTELETLDSEGMTAITSTPIRGLFGLKAWTTSPLLRGYRPTYHELVGDDDEDETEDDEEAAK